MQNKVEKINTLNTTQHVKIWFTKPNADAPLGNILNELRLLAHIAKNKNHIIHLIVYKKQLSERGLERLEKLCSYNESIQLHDLDDLELQNDTEIQLLDIAKEEITNPFGNLAAASDIIRTLRCVHKMGIYSDLDVSFLGDIPESIECGDILIDGVTLGGNMRSLGIMQYQVGLVGIPNPESYLITLGQNYILGVYEESNIKNLSDIYDKNLYGSVFELRREQKDNKNFSIKKDIMRRSGGWLHHAIDEYFPKGDYYRSEILAGMHLPKNIFINNSELDKKIDVAFDNSWYPETEQSAGIDAVKLKCEDIESSSIILQSIFRTKLTMKANEEKLDNQENAVIF